MTEQMTTINEVARDFIFLIQNPAQYLSRMLAWIIELLLLASAVALAVFSIEYVYKKVKLWKNKEE